MPNIMDVIASTVIFLFSIGPNPQPIGTGFIIGCPVPNSEKAIIPIVVTAKHVLGDHQKVLGRFSTQEGASTAFVRYDIASLKKSNDYWEHPYDNGVDIAVFRSLHYEAMKYNALPMDLIATKKMFKEEKIRQTDQIIFPSLLINFMGSSMNYPVFRDGIIAVIPNEKVPMKFKVGDKQIETDQEVIFIDATSIPGASGSPIFLWPGPRFKGRSYVMGGTTPYLLGIMHGLYPVVPREDLKVETSESKDMYAENSGIAIIFPSWKLHDILQCQNFKDRINQIAETEDTK